MNSLLALALQPLCAHPGVRSILLAGSDGDLVGWLLDAVGTAGPLLHVAGSNFGFDVAAMRARGGDRILLHPSRAAETLLLMPIPDLLIIDGDANWHAVSTTLQATARQAATQAAPFPLTVVSDTAWPYARRDRYTHPGAMPLAFVKPHERAGVLPGQPGLAAGAGLFADRFHATTENEPGNGVLTAIEEFLLEQDGRLGMASLPLLHGISLIYDKTRPQPEHVRSALESFQLGDVARKAAAATEQARVALAADTARLHVALASAKYGFDAARSALDQEREARGKAGYVQAIMADPKAFARRLPVVLRNVVRTAVSSVRGERGSALAEGRSEASAQDVGDDEAKIERLRRSPILDATWYVNHHDDIGGTQADPASHYYLHGAAEGRDPGPAFSTRYYLDENPDVAAAGHNPLLHYLASGAREGRDPGPHFSSAFYLQSNPDVAEAGLNPLEHYLVDGRQENRLPLPPTL